MSAVEGYSFNFLKVKKCWTTFFLPCHSQQGWLDYKRTTKAWNSACQKWRQNANKPRRGAITWRRYTQDVSSVLSAFCHVPNTKSGCCCSLQEKNNLEIDLNYKLKTLQQRLEQEQTEHRVTRAQLTDKYESIEEAKSAAMNGIPPPVCGCSSAFLICSLFPFMLLLSPFSFFQGFFKAGFIWSLMPSYVVSGFLKFWL